MLFKCPLCGNELDADRTPDEGEQLECPYCEKIFTYSSQQVEDELKCDNADDSESGFVQCVIVCKLKKWQLYLLCIIPIIIVGALFAFYMLKKNNDAKIVSEVLTTLQNDNFAGYDNSLSNDEDGNYFTDSEIESAEFYRKRAEDGDMVAQFNLGLSYSLGVGVVEDEQEAVKWYRKAAEQGYMKAQFALGFSYSLGDGVAKDQREAVKWFHKAAELGYADAQYKLGNCYRFGLGVTKDKQEAVKWYRKAAEQGNADAQYKLGCCYEDGEGVAKDKQEAAKWYRKAAEQGNEHAQVALDHILMLDEMDEMDVDVNVDTLKDINVLLPWRH